MAINDKNNKELNKFIVRNVKFEDLKAAANIVITNWKTVYRGLINDDFLDSLSVEERYIKYQNNYKESGFIVAERNGEILGICRYVKGNNYKEKYPEIDCEITVLYVKIQEKGNGIGKALVNFVKEEFKKNNLKKMIIWCLKENYPARKFYEKMGGALCGEIPCLIGKKVYTEVGFIYDLNA